MSDHIRVRNQTFCPFCGEHKDIGLVACWPCFRSSGLKYGDESAEEILSAFEAALTDEATPRGWRFAEP
jgi:hypothetical protein